MKPDILEINTALQMQKPVNEVFEAIVDPQKMSNYFISRSDGRMEEGKTLHWEFPEFKNKAWPVRIDKIDSNKYISFYWEGAPGYETHVEFDLESPNINSALVKISEKSMKNDADGIKWLRSNTEGWMNFLTCLKAYLEYGINLRKGGYDFLITND